MHFGRMHDLVFGGIDNLTAEDQAVTIADAMNKRAMPYIYLKRASEVKKWTTTRTGRLLTIDFYDELVPSHDDNGRAIMIQTYRHWEPGKWLTYKIEKDKDSNEIEIKIDEGTIDIAELPVIAMLDFSRGDNLKELPDPAAYDLAYLCFTLFNKESELRNLERAQSFSLLYIQGVDQQSMTVGPNNVLLLNDETKIPPGYISSNPAHYENQLNSCEKMRQMIRENAGQKGVLVAEPHAAASGVSKEWDFRGEEKVLRRTSLAAKKLEMNIAHLFQLFTNTTFDYQPGYPEKFDPGINDKKATNRLQSLREMPPKVLAAEYWVQDARDNLGDAIDIPAEGETVPLADKIRQELLAGETITAVNGPGA